MNYQDPIIKHIPSEIYTPSDDTYLLLDYVKENFYKKQSLENIKNILDMGTGTGIIAIFFALLVKENHKFNSKIYASDILKESIECAIMNERENNLNNSITFIQSDLFDSFPNSLKNTFDIIIFNPPYLPSFDINEKISKSKQDYSWNGGPKGYELLKKFLKDAPLYLRKNSNSCIYYISSTRMDLDLLSKFIQKRGFKNKILRKKHFFFEDIILNKLKPYII
jgi:HemK-related putative methylase